MKRTALVVIPLLALAACGGGSGYDSAAGVAKDLGCAATYQHTSAAEAEMFTSDSGHCRVAGHDVTVNWFKNSDTLDHFKSVADQFGTRLLVGDDWIVECGDSCAQAKAKLGGSLD